MCGKSVMKYALDARGVGAKNAGMIIPAFAELNQAAAGAGAPSPGSLGGIGFGTSGSGVTA